MFCLVEFDGPTKEVAIAHRNWLSGKKCYWPPFWKVRSKYIAALKIGTPPQPGIWKLYDVHIVGNRYFETYDMARKKLNLPQTVLDASELSSMEDEERLRKRTRHESASEEESEHDDVLQSQSTPKRKKQKKMSELKVFTLSPPPAPPQTDQNLGMQSPYLVTVDSLNEGDRTLVASNENINQSFVRSAVQTGGYETYSQPVYSPEVPLTGHGISSGVNDTVTFNPVQGSNTYMRAQGGYENIRQTQSHRVLAPMIATQGHDHMQYGFSTNNTDYGPVLREILNGQAILTAKVDMALDYLRTLSNCRPSASNRTTAFLNLPLTTLEEADALEIRLREDADAKDELINALETRGGNTANQVVHRIMTILMTDELMALYTFAGRTTDRRCFKDHMFLTCICAAARKQPKGSVSSDKEIEKAAEYWLKNASRRIEKRNKQFFGGQAIGGDERNEEEDG